MGVGRYVAIPGFENHALGLPEKISIKAGICSRRCNPQRYVNSRYGPSLLLDSDFKTGITFDEMKVIEKRVLSDLVSVYGYMKQHGKKEHFIISSSTRDRNRFVDRVRRLYERYMS